MSSWAVGVVIILFAACSARGPDEVPLPYRQAEDAFRLGSYELAVRGYNVFLRSQEREYNKDLVPRAYYRMALAQFRLGWYRECLAVLDEIEPQVPERGWSQVYELRGDAEQAMGNTISALRWWELAWLAASGDEKSARRRRITDALMQMDASTLRRARPVLTSPEVRRIVDDRARQFGARHTAVPDVSAGQPGPTATRAPEAEASVAVQPLIACLLPRTGPHAIYGQRSLNGIRLALGEHADRLVVRDTHGLVSVGRAALDRLIAQPDIVAVIGPLRSKVAEAIAPRAERAGLPMVLLSQRRGISGTSVLQPAMTDQRQAAELAEYAVRERGLRRFGILHPRTSYGMALSQAFREEVERHQGRVVGTLAYSPDAPEFSLEVLSVQRWIDRNGLEAVFVPDFAATAVALGSALRRAQPDLTLLGSNGWHDPLRLGSAMAELEGAVFVDGFFVASQRRATREFVDAYQREYQAMPDILEAQAYDAATLVLNALQAGARTRERVVPSLRALQVLEGAAGNLVVEPGGVRRRLFLLRVTGGTIREVVWRGSTASGMESAAPAP